MTVVAVARALLFELRPVQWVKNLTCLAGLIFSGRLFLARHEMQAALGFWAFCFASSAVYILNDFIDRDKDRLNPRTAVNAPARLGRPHFRADRPAFGVLCTRSCSRRGASRPRSVRRVSAWS